MYLGLSVSYVRQLLVAPAFVWLHSRIRLQDYFHLFNTGNTLVFSLLINSLLLNRHLLIDLLYLILQLLNLLYFVQGAHVWLITRINRICKLTMLPLLAAAHFILLVTYAFVLRNNVYCWLAPPIALIYLFIFISYCRIVIRVLFLITLNRRIIHFLQMKNY